MSEQGTPGTAGHLVVATLPVLTPNLPSIADLFTKLSLYEIIHLDQRVDLEPMRKLKLGEWQFDAYCDRCKRPSIFKAFPTSARSMYEHDDFWWDKADAADYSAICVRCHRAYTIHTRRNASHIRKVGQDPSLEDIASADLLPLKKALSQDDLSELRRAGGLFAHGIGIGSFVYLRRIFERLIDRHWAEAYAAGEDLESLVGKRMDEKIGILRDHLPAAVVKHKVTYAILSKGIHELDEDTCRTFFPIVRKAIMTILEQDVRRREAAAAEAELERQLQAIAGKLSSAPAIGGGDD